MINDNSSDYLINPVRQLHTPLDVTTAFEQYSPQKTYTELLPRKSQSNVNVSKKRILLNSSLHVHIF